MTEADELRRAIDWRESLGESLNVDEDMKKCLRALESLPPPPARRAGWPWTTAGPPLPRVMSDGRPWPKITIVTPNYNYGRFLEETLRSVLLQGYPDLEYIVVDGGSTDHSAGIIRAYADHLAFWVNEPDRGQAHAINKGLGRATGDLVAWINSDDLYLPSALAQMAIAHRGNPDALILGDVENFRDDAPDRCDVTRQVGVTFENLVEPWNGRSACSQPGVFVPRALVERVGLLDETLRYAFDRDWLCRLIREAPVAYLGAAVARFRFHGGAKTVKEVPAAMNEVLTVTRRYWDLLPELDKGRVLADHSVHEAAWYLAHHPTYAVVWDRAAGLSSLATAVRQDPRVLLSAHFLRLFRRAVLPRRWLRSVPWRVSAA